MIDRVAEVFDGEVTWEKAWTPVRGVWLKRKVKHNPWKPRRDPYPPMRAIRANATHVVCDVKGLAMEFRRAEVEVHHLEAPSGQEG